MPTTDGTDTKYVVDADLVKVYETKGKKGFVTMLAWGDEVEVVKFHKDYIEVKATKFVELKDKSVKPTRMTGFIVPPKNKKPEQVVIPKEESKVLKIDFVDVQQGDGAVIETSKGTVILIDGGDTAMFPRYLANRYRNTSDKNPKKIDCILVTHGDADHFQGLIKIHQSETEERLNKMPWKRLFISPDRIYHNGLVKRPGEVKQPGEKKGRKVPDVKLLGQTKTVTDPETNKEITIITGLEEDLLEVPRTEMNQPFKDWAEALETYKERAQKRKIEMKFRRLERGMNDAFDFVKDEGIHVDVLGPIMTKVGEVEGLKFLGDPPKGPRTSEEFLNTSGSGFKGKSASHTINGHSVVFRLAYGCFNVLFTGDLNDEAGQTLAREHNMGRINLQSEVFKVPHHGSADFSGAFIQAVAPVISVVSSGDENARKEYIHPRATIMGALGKYGRVEEPLVFVTEMVAFFETVGQISPECHLVDEKGEAVIKQGKSVPAKKIKAPFYAFKRTAFGIVMIRTDGQRLLVYTNSGQTKLKEAYAYAIDEWGKPESIAVSQV